ncbi:hypothetical protein FXO37_22170 [Capsicum annuum]|nr:hypothetical protein FXO37_22170 [Capsicum annuum]
MAARATITRFPVDNDALEESGILWGVTISPFSTKDENGNPPVYGSDGHLLPRCENCWAYYNTYCEQEQWAWTCSLCGTLNGLDTQAVARYSLPESCPENVSSFIDLELPSHIVVPVCIEDWVSFGENHIFTLNGLDHQAVARYSLPESCPENVSSFIDLVLPSKCSMQMPFTVNFVLEDTRLCNFGNSDALYCKYSVLGTHLM